MKSLLSLSAALVLTLALALPAVAGEAPCPGLTTTVPTQDTATGIMPNGATATGDIPSDLGEMVLGIIEGMLVAP
jgi:hypothetical protein